VPLEDIVNAGTGQSNLDVLTRVGARGQSFDIQTLHGEARDDQ